MRENLVTVKLQFSIFELVFHAACICIAHPYDCVKPFAFFFVFGMVMYDNKFKTKQNKIWTEDNMEPQLEQ